MYALYLQPQLGLLLHRLHCSQGDQVLHKRQPLPCTSGRVQRTRTSELPEGRAAALPRQGRRGSTCLEELLTVMHGVLTDGSACDGVPRLPIQAVHRWSSGSCIHTPTVGKGSIPRPGYHCGQGVDPKAWLPLKEVNVGYSRIKGGAHAMLWPACSKPNTEGSGSDGWVRDILDLHLGAAAACTLRT